MGRLRVLKIILPIIYSKQHLDYDKIFGDHHLNVIAGYSYQDIFNEGFSAGNNTFLTNAYGYNNLGAGTALNTL